MSRALPFAALCLALLLSPLSRADEPLPAAERAAIDREIAQLASRQFAEREAASKALIKRGRQLLVVLAARAPHKDLEVRQRLSQARIAIQDALARKALPEVIGEGQQRCPLRGLEPLLAPGLASALGSTRGYIARYQSEPVVIGPGSTRRWGHLRRVLVSPTGDAVVYDLSKQRELWNARALGLLNTGEISRARGMQRAQAYWQLVCYRDRAVDWKETKREGGGWVITGLARHYYSKTPPWKEQVTLELDADGRVLSLVRSCPGIDKR